MEKFPKVKKHRPWGTRYDQHHYHDDEHKPEESGDHAVKEEKSAEETPEVKQERKYTCVFPTELFVVIMCGAVGAETEQ